MTLCKPSIVYLSFEAKEKYLNLAIGIQYNVPVQLIL